MASLGMGSESYTLNTVTIDNEVAQSKIGNYALGHRNEKGTFIVKYVGRSDTDLNARLKQHADAGKHKEFKFSYAGTAKAAFETECRNFHDFGETEKLANSIHPDRPKGENFECPCCTIFDKEK